MMKYIMSMCLAASLSACAVQNKPAKETKAQVVKKGQHFICYDHFSILGFHNTFKSESCYISKSDHAKGVF